MDAKGALILLGLLIGGGLAFLAFLRLLLGLAVSVLKVTALILTGLGLLAGLTVLLAWGLSLALMAHERWKHEQESRLLLQSIGLPRDAVIRGQAPPRSRLEQTLAVLMGHYLTQEVGCDPRRLSDLELNELRMRFAEFLRRPAFAALLEREFVQPAFRLLVKDDPFLLEQMRLFGQLKVRVNFWPVYRLLHLISGGRLGLSAKDTWKVMSVDELKADYKAFGKWARTHGLGLIPVLEVLIEAQHVKLDAGELGLGTPVDQAQASALIQGVRAVLAEDEPWMQPGERLAQLSDALGQARRMDPRHPDLDDLDAQVQAMTQHLQDFKPDYAAALAWMPGSPDPLPTWLDHAYAFAADELSEESLEAHAVRLYLRMRGEVTQNESPSSSPATSPNQGSPPPQADEVDPPLNDEAVPPNAPKNDAFTDPAPYASPHPPIDPHAAAHAQATF